MNYLITRQNPKGKRRLAVVKYKSFDSATIKKDFREQCLLLKEGEFVLYSKKRKGSPEIEVLKVGLINGKLLNMLSKMPYNFND